MRRARGGLPQEGARRRAAERGVKRMRNDFKPALEKPRRPRSSRCSPRSRSAANGKKEELVDRVIEAFAPSACSRARGSKRARPVEAEEEAAPAPARPRRRRRIEVKVVVRRRSSSWTCGR